MGRRNLRRRSCLTTLLSQARLCAKRKRSGISIRNDPEPTHRLQPANKPSPRRSSPAHHPPRHALYKTAVIVCAFVFLWQGLAAAGFGFLGGGDGEGV